MNEGLAAVYWDASAVLSALMLDEFSDQAQEWSKRDGIHLVSTLSCAEVYAVLFRLQREKKVNDKAIQGIIEAFELGPWQKLNLQPEWRQMKLLASQWSLRGADLWHLATAAMIRMDLPELVLLTFDKRLLLAAKGERLF